MTNSDNLRIKVLDENTEYGLWRIRLEGACDLNNCAHARTANRPDISISDAYHAVHRKTAIGIIVCPVNDAALRVVRSVIGKPVEMLQKLDARYDSKWTSSKISKIVDLLSLEFVTVRSDVSKHIYKMAVLL